MAAGLGFKTFTSGEVLTAANVNGYLMQGINVFASATARDAAITSPQEGQFAFTKDTNGLWYYDGAAWVASGATGDIEGVTAGVGISGGGTSGTVTVTNSMATAITAKGDLIVGTGSGTFQREAVGANGTVLTADSAQADGVKWAAPAAAASSFTLLNTGDTTIGTGTTKTWSGISGINTLFIMLRNVVVNSNSPDVRFRVNGNTGTVYNNSLIQNNWVASYAATNYTTSFPFAATRVDLGSSAGSGGVGGAVNGGFQIYGANTANHKMFTVMSGGNAYGGVASQKHFFANGFITDSATISSITVLDAGGNNFGSGDVYIYGSAV
jgi:hypothetical protein